MPGVSTAAKVLLLEQLASVGGATALKTVVAAAKSSDDAMQDAATRLLGKWLSADAAPAMFDLAKTLPEGKYKIRALRGYVRIARQLNMTPDERMTVCRNTLAIAERSEDRVLIFEVVRRYPTPEGLSLAASLLSDKDLQQQACSTIVATAADVAMKAPEQTEKALLQVLELSTDPALKANAEKAIVIARDSIRLKKEEAQFTPVFDGVSLKRLESRPARCFASKRGRLSAVVSKKRSGAATITFVWRGSMATSNSGWKPESKALPMRTVGSMFVQAGLKPAAIRSTWDRRTTAAFTTNCDAGECSLGQIPSK